MKEPTHYFAHLLNDYSGSPRITNERILQYRSLGKSVYIITNDNNGFINTSSYPHHLIAYKKDKSKFIWMLRLLVWYILALFYILRKVKKNDVFHASTLLTAPLFMAAKIKGCYCVSHIMETSIRPFFFLSFLKICQKLADKNIFLSQYVSSKYPINTKINWVTYPCISPVIFSSAETFLKKKGIIKQDTFKVGLICSLSIYKGYHNFIKLATQSLDKNLEYILIINGDEKSFYSLIDGVTMPNNLKVYFNIKDISMKLQQISLLVSLTQRESWIETFGLTLVEAMAFGIPVIAPSIGAPLEYIEENRNGFTCDESNLDQILEIIQKIANHPSLYQSLSEGARQTALKFNPNNWQAEIENEILFIEGKHRK